MDLVQVAIPPTPLKKALKGEYLTWIDECKEICEQQVAILENNWSEAQKRNKKKKKIPYQELNRHRKLSEYALKLKTLSETWWDTEYLIENEDDILVFKPYNVDKLADRWKPWFPSITIPEFGPRGGADCCLAIADCRVLQ